MTLSASWGRPTKLGNRLVDWVARAPGRVQTKLLVAFLTIAGLLVVVSAVALSALSGVNDQTQQLIKLQREIAAYRQVAANYPTREAGAASLWRLGWLGYLKRDTHAAQQNWMRLAELGELEVDWRLFSLEVVNRPEGTDPAELEPTGSPALRTAVLVAKEHGTQALGPFYAALGRRTFESAPPPSDPIAVIRESLVEVGHEGRR